MQNDPRKTQQDDRKRDDAWLDEALDETFPASDPLPLGHKTIDVKDAETGNPAQGTEGSRN